jgi:hypothetical protein
MSEVETVLLGALRDLQHPGDNRTAVVRQTDAELHGPGVYHEQLCRYLQLNEVPAKSLTVGLDGRLTGEVICFRQVPRSNG